ncbi:MAG: OmpH/Skp family outer membrane protein [Chitinophagaceae bacterium]
MNKVAVFLNVVLLVLVGILFYWHFKGKEVTGSARFPIQGMDTSEQSQGHFRVAYINMDTLEAQYSYIQAKKLELQKKQTAIENELQGNAQSLQQEVAALRQKAPTLTQAQGDLAQNKIMQEQQQLQVKEQILKQQLLQQQNQFMDELQKRIDRVLTQVNGNHRYALIFSYEKGLSNILYKGGADDITREVISGLNQDYPSSGK